MCVGVRARVGGRGRECDMCVCVCRRAKECVLVCVCAQQVALTMPTGRYLDDLQPVAARAPPALALTACAYWRVPGRLVAVVAELQGPEGDGEERGVEGGDEEQVLSVSNRPKTTKRRPGSRQVARAVLRVFLKKSSKS